MKIKVLISGHVQGVFYRARTKEKAKELGLRGWVKNLTDGTVEAVFEGPKEKVKEMIKWCWLGSPGSEVEKVEEVSPNQNKFGSGQASVSKEELEGFEIRY